MESIAPAHRSIIERLLDGEDPTTLEGYPGLLELVAELPTMTEEYRRDLLAIADRIVVGESQPRLRTANDPVGWASVAEYRAYGRNEVELITSEAARRMFVARLPVEDRARFDANRALVTAPTMTMTLDRGGAAICHTCGRVLDAAELYMVIRDAAGDDDGWRVCGPCAGPWLPAEMPLRQALQVNASPSVTR